ncbi:hypothetical protein PSGK_21090 [Pseudomonas solani]|uniref:hypothetical protein n=1 Tax=Pseudomonas solani TaxID=2731552 RepID=UPI0035BE1D99
MKCKECSYEFSMREIQDGSPCPECARRAQAAAVQASRPTPVYVKPQEVVVVDFKMSFNSMVWFMVKAAFASIPALIIIAIVLAVLNLLFGGALLGLAGLLGR